MSPVEKMSYLQTRMHFDESMESNADSDLEDGEIRKLLTSQRASETRCNGVQEREVSAQTSHSSEDHRASGKPAALFSPKSDEQRNQMWSSVFGNANVSNLSKTLLEGNKDHMLNRARTDLAEEKFMSSRSISASLIYKNERRYKIGNYKKYNTNLLNLVENKLDYKKN